VLIPTISARLEINAVDLNQRTPIIFFFLFAISGSIFIVGFIGFATTAPISRFLLIDFMKFVGFMSMLRRSGNMDVWKYGEVKLNFFEDERLKLVRNVKKLRALGEGSYLM